MVEGTGRLITTDAGMQLVIDREFRTDLDDLWAWVTESDKLEQWIGRWSGEAAVGSVVEFTMAIEASDEPEQVTILECSPPRRLQVGFESEAGRWHLEVNLRAAGEVTVLEFSHTLDQGDDVTGVGPAWEYYLDLLAAARGGLSPRAFSDYSPGLIPYYADLG